MLNWFNNLKISKKLVLSFLLVAVIAAAVGVVGLFYIFQINHADTLLYHQNAMGLRYSGASSANFQRIRYNALKMATSDSAAEIEDIAANMGAICDTMDENLSNYETTISGDSTEAAAVFSEITSEWTAFKEYLEKVEQLVRSGNSAQAQKIVLTETQDLGDSLRENLYTLMDLDAAQAEIRSTNNDGRAQTSIIIMIVMIVVGFGISLFLGIYISRIIGNPLSKIAVAAEQLAVGDLNVDIAVKSKDEIGTLADAFQKLIISTQEQARIAQYIADGDLTVDVAVRSTSDVLGNSLSEMLQKFSGVIETIVIAADQVAAGSNLVSNSSISLSQGASEQASSVEELTASLEEISSQTNLNAQNANKANTLTRNAEENAVNGNRQMKEMLSAMTEINESSASINKIIKVIDDIAFQTNILALNAAVEAARAGQHGKGFAVVAEEVRNLAARSANAAKETTEMIESSIKKSEAGTRIANNTAHALDQIVEQVKNAAALVGEIASASAEQASGIEQINQGIMQVSQVVQTNAATSEESAAASEELSTQASRLKETVSIFKMNRLDISNEAASASSLPMNAQAQPLSKSKAQISLAGSGMGKY